MTIVDFSVVLIGALFGIYAVCASVECGIVLKMLTPGHASRKLFTPLWEVTNVFLVFGFTAMAMLFNGAINSISHALTTTLAVALVSLLVRACVALAIFYIWPEDELPSWLTWLLAATTFLVPLSFAAAGIYLLSGQLFWSSWLGWVLELSTLLGLAATGLLFVNRRSGDKPRAFGEAVAGLWLLSLGCVLPLVSLHTNDRLQHWPLLALVISSGITLAALLARYVELRRLKLWFFAALLVFLTPILLGLANRPDLIAGKLSLASAYGAQAYGSAIVIGLVVMLPLIVLGGWLFWKLFSVQDSSKT